MTALPSSASLAGFFRADALRPGPGGGRSSVVLQLLVIGRRGDDAHELRPALFGDADLDDLEPIGFLFELGPVAHQLLVIGQAIIVAEVEAEVFLRRGDGLRLGLTCRRGSNSITTKAKASRKNKFRFIGKLQVRKQRKGNAAIMSTGQAERNKKKFSRDAQRHALRPSISPLTTCATLNLNKFGSTHKPEAPAKGSVFLVQHTSLKRQRRAAFSWFNTQA